MEIKMERPNLKKTRQQKSQIKKATPKASKTKNGQRLKRPNSEKTKFPQG